MHYHKLNKIAGFVWHHYVYKLTKKFLFLGIPELIQDLKGSNFKIDILFINTQVCIHIF